jgi:hypothetical protein
MTAIGKSGHSADSHAAAIIVAVNHPDLITTLNRL